jgi:hypothetical protein
MCYHLNCRSNSTRWFELCTISFGFCEEHYKNYLCSHDVFQSHGCVVCIIENEFMNLPLVEIVSASP